MYLRKLTSQTEVQQELEKREWAEAGGTLADDPTGSSS